MPAGPASLPGLPNTRLSGITSHCLFLLIGFLARVPRQDHGNQENGSYQIEATLVLGRLGKFLQQTLMEGLGSAGWWQHTSLSPPPPQTSDSVACGCHSIPFVWAQSPSSIFYKISVFPPLPTLPKSFLTVSEILIRPNPFVY